MLRSKTRHFMVAALLLAATTAVTATAQRVLADITGNWTMTVAGPQGAMQSGIVFKQAGDSLTGTVTSEMFGAAKLVGFVKGDTVGFAYTIAVEGMEFELSAGGILKDKDNFAGELIAPGGMGSFPFTMKRVP